MLTMNPQRRRNLKVVAPCLVIGIMIGVVVYSPTLYRLFCAADGIWRNHAKDRGRLRDGVRPDDHRAVR